jgi:DNA polymerase IV
MSRSIIHLNIADFAAAVEINLQASLKGYPFIIAPLGAPRAVVYDMSEEAYRQGIRKGMLLTRARRLNKKIKIIPPDFMRYELIMKDLLKDTFVFTPQVESGKYDGHIFMDVTGTSRLFGPSVDIAFRLKKAFKKQFNLDPVWSVATSKLIAKVATRVVKPVGEYIVAPGDEKAFLAPLPLHFIPGLDKSDLTKLKEFNISFVSQARIFTLKQLQIPFNYRASLIYDRLRGIDPSLVTIFDDAHESVYADHEFDNDTNNAFVLKQAVYLMVEKICKNLRVRKILGAGIKITIFYSDGVLKKSKSRIIPSTSNDMDMFKKCSRLFDKAWTRRIRIRHIRLVCNKFSMAHVQANLFEDSTKKTKQIHLIAAMDKIRAKFGRTSVKTGLTMMLPNSIYSDIIDQGRQSNQKIPQISFAR